MAIAAIPIAKVYLVEHAGGGAIVHAAGGYVGNTLIPAAIIEGFSAASSALATIGATATSLASNPYVLAGAAIGVVAIGTYSYFYGVPAPIEAALIKAGLAEPAKHGLLIPAAKLATGLVLLGLAGLVSYNFYKRLREAKAATKGREAIKISGAQATVEATLGSETWTTYGNALWGGVTDTAFQIANVANTLLNSLANATTSAGAAIAGPTRSISQFLADTYVGAISKLRARSK